MNEVTANYFRQHLKKNVDQVIESHDVLHVTRRSGEDFVVLSAEDWHAIEETIYLNQVSGLVESIHRAAKEPIEKGTPLRELDW